VLRAAIDHVVSPAKARPVTEEVARAASRLARPLKGRPATSMVPTLRVRTTEWGGSPTRGDSARGTASVTPRTPPCFRSVISSDAAPS
jgi:hypothetical protein